MTILKLEAQEPYVTDRRPQLDLFEGETQLWSENVQLHKRHIAEVYLTVRPPKKCNKFRTRINCAVVALWQNNHGKAFTR